MRALALFLALSACVDAGQSVDWPAPDAELAFLIWVDGGQVTGVSSPFRLEGGVATGLERSSLRHRESETVVLISLSKSDLVSLSPLIDLKALTGAQLLVELDSSCELLYSEDRRSLEVSLPPGGGLAAIAPKGADTALLDALRMQLRLQLPLAERPCEPPLEVHPFGRDALAIADLSTFFGQIRRLGSAEDAPFFELYDAQYLSADEAVIATARGIAFVARGAFVQGDGGPDYIPSTADWLGWPVSTRPVSVVVLRTHSTEQRQRFLVVGDWDIRPEVSETWVLTLEREGAGFAVLNSTVAAGQGLRAQVDHQGRALIVTRRDDLVDRGLPGESVVLWTTDGLNWRRRTLPYLSNYFVPTGEDARPHLLARSGPGQVVYGDLTDEREDALTLLSLDTGFRDAIRSMAAQPTSAGIQIALGGENRSLRTVVLAATPPSPSDWRVLRPIVDASTAEVDCAGIASECGNVELPAELDQLTLFRRRDGTTWLFLTPTLCPHLVAIRGDDCTTHTRLDPVASIMEERSLHSIRLSPDGTRALVAGRGSRLFEVTFLP